MKPYYEYIDIPNLKQLSKNLLLAMPRKVRSESIFASYDPNEFLKDVPGLIDAVELVRPWEECSEVALITHHPDLINWPIHVDGAGDLRFGVALNIPVFNCENCYSIMYEEIDRPASRLVLTPDTVLPYRMFNPEDVRQVDTVNYKGHAVLLNTEKPHTIVNPTHLPRIVASFRFTPPILWGD
jgi:hypothetical protein